MGRVQGGARAAFATLSGGPSQQQFNIKKSFLNQKQSLFPLKKSIIFLYLRHHWGIVKW